MNIFSDGSSVCVGCRHRFPTTMLAKSVNGIGLCRECFAKISPVPLFNPLEGSKNVKYHICGYYYEGIIKDLIHRYKFNGEYSLCELFSDMLHDRIRDIRELDDFDFMTCVPISRQRLSSRGYNQSELIAKSVSERLKLPYVTCVHKHRHTIAQSLLKKSGRIANIRDAFIADAERVCGNKILLFDDIITTGATINECSGELYDKGASFVAGLSLAVTRRKTISEALNALGSGF